LPRLYYNIICKNIVNFFQKFEVGYTQTCTSLESNIMWHPKGDHHSVLSLICTFKIVLGAMELMESYSICLNLIGSPTTTKKIQPIILYAHITLCNFYTHSIITCTWLKLVAGNFSWWLHSSIEFTKLVKCKHYFENKGFCLFETHFEIQEHVKQMKSLHLIHWAWNPDISFTWQVNCNIL
jgi:hypothetical protein